MHGSLSLALGMSHPTSALLRLPPGTRDGSPADFAAHPEERAENLAYYRETTDVAGGPIRANPDLLIQEITDHAAAWNYLSQASALRSHAVLLVAATRDSSDENPERHAELAEAIRREGGKLVRVVTFEDDHPFSSHRIALADTLTHWLRTRAPKHGSAAEI